MSATISIFTYCNITKGHRDSCHPLGYLPSFSPVSALILRSFIHAASGPGLEENLGVGEEG